MDFSVKDLATAGAFLLGLYNLYRTYALERRLEVKPFFKKIWGPFHIQLSSHLDATNHWCIESEKYLASGDRYECLWQFPDRVRTPTLDTEARRFNHAFAASLDEYVAITQELRRLVSDLNRLLDPVTTGFQVFSMAYNAGETFGREESADKVEAKRQRMGDARQIARKYLGDNENVTTQDLRQNEAYNEEVDAFRERVAETVTRLKAAREAIIQQAKVLDADVGEANKE